MVECWSSSAAVQKVAEKRDFEARLRHATTGKLCQPSSKWVLLGWSIREGYGSERRVMGSAFHQLCPRYSETLTPLPLRLLGYGKPLPFLF